MNRFDINALEGKDIQVHITDELAIHVTDRNGQPIWSSSAAHPPTVTDTGQRSFPLHSATMHEVTALNDGGTTGYRIELSGFDGSAAEVALRFVLDTTTDTLSVQAEQVGDAVRQINHLYRFDKPASQGGYMLLPHGSGYLIDADCPDELPGSLESDYNIIGARWSMPWFAMVHGHHTMMIIIEDWWDCQVEPYHEPGRQSSLEFSWLASLGKLSYPRRQLIRFARDMDHVAMAKAYREHARGQGLVRTLEEKAVDTPVIGKYINNVLARWPAWDPKLEDAVLADLKKFVDAGLSMTHFFPKWPGRGFSPEAASANLSNGGWQGWLHPNPVPGGWALLAGYNDKVHDLGCLTQGFLNPLVHCAGAPHFDEARLATGEDGQRDEVTEDSDHTIIMSHDLVEIMAKVFDNLRRQQLSLDVLYYDGFSAFVGTWEDFTPQHRSTRRDGFECQVQVMADTRRNGIMPGAELARFWAIGECDYFFYTDWAGDRLTNVVGTESTNCVGEPVPLFELVFHDCYVAGFSGGGYANYAVGHDWWRDRTPRLYEMMFCCAPAFNWLPQSDVPVRDWDSDRMDARLAWLKRWSAFYSAIAMSEMTSHQFLADDRDMQRIEFANGVTAEFDMKNNLCRVNGVEGFTGQWQTPAEDLGPHEPSNP